MKDDVIRAFYSEAYRIAFAGKVTLGLGLNHKCRSDIERGLYIVEKTYYFGTHTDRIKLPSLNSYRNLAMKDAVVQAFYSEAYRIAVVGKVTSNLGLNRKCRSDMERGF